MANRAMPRTTQIFVVGARGIPDVEGGAEKNAERLFPRLAALGWKVTLAGLAEHLHGDDYRGVALIGTPGSRILRTDKLAYYLAAMRIGWRLRPSLVHFQGLGSALFLWAYKLMGAKTVVRYGSADYLVGKWGLIGRAGFRAAEYQLRFADAVIAVTPALARRLERQGVRANVHVVPNARDDVIVDFAEADPGQELPQPYMLAVGRVTEQKNIARLMAGFNLFADRHPGFHLVVAGGIDAEYESAIAPHRSERIRLVGRQPRSSLGALYRRAFAFINASIHEGHSNATLEAISWGLPLLISDIPENRDFELGEVHLFDPGSPAAIAAALERAVADREALVVDAARLPDWDEVARRTDAIYRSLGLAPADPARG